MDSTELREHLADVDADTPYYELLILDHDDRGAWWACNLCGDEITDHHRGCLTHAPTNIPGLYRVDCDAEPQHAPMWVRDGEHTGYGVPCPQCMYSRVAADLTKAEKRDRCYHWGWRRWAFTKWAVGRAYALGLISGYSTGTVDGCDWCLRFGRSLRGKRPYILGVRRETWRCWLNRHRRGEHVGFGYCGKCVPWPCCGSQRVEHADGCTEVVRDAARAVTA